MAYRTSWVRLRSCFQNLKARRGETSNRRPGILDCLVEPGNDTDWILRRLEIGLPRLDRDFERGIAALAPQFTAVEYHGVEPVRFLAAAGDHRIGEDVAAADAFDDADVAADVARQARVADGMHVLHADAVADRKARRRCGRPLER